MEWVFLVLFAAIFVAVISILNKKALRVVTPYSIGFWTSLFSLIAVTPFALANVPTVLDSNFWTALLITGVLNVVAIAAHLKALEKADVSLVEPLKSFSVILMIFSSFY